VGFALLCLVLAPATTLPEAHDHVARQALQHYLVNAARHGATQDVQGVWLQSAKSVLLHHRGSVPLPAASLTKVATTLAALRTWGPRHRFPTLVGAAGTIRNGVLHGDLVVHGGSDPFFVWEDAIILGNTLRQAGITRVNGRLLVAGRFYMNFVLDSVAAGGLLKQGLNTATWPKGANAQYHTLPKGTPEPRVAISGPVQVASQAPLDGHVLLVRHRSLPLFDILKRMNIYSNNAMAEMLTIAMGGSGSMRHTAVQTAGVDRNELRLSNGSGLGRRNQISPRAACALFIAIHNLLQPDGLNVSDVFPIAGRDHGTIEHRDIPLYAVVKTGTLGNVSTLGGVIFTRRHGPVWFALLNQGNNRSALRVQQDTLLNSLTRSWGSVDNAPASFRPFDFAMEFERDSILNRQSRY
jgi:D-alanyl-D-alanine carboxypeptidase/D-alanyl-D-alanine-endopeptidase (penicillin-binding protein 4)